MNLKIYILFITLLATSRCYAQEGSRDKTYLVPATVYEGDTIPYVRLPEVYIFKPMKFKNAKESREYDRLVYNVKKTLPLAKEVKKIVIETYEYMQTLPDEKSKQKHVKAVEKGLKEQYTPLLKKMSFSQGKLLIKLVDRECNQTSYELAKAFIGSFRAGFYQTFAGLFGASLKKGYDPQGEDKMVERIVLMVENGQL